jgi:hypothetical protein
VRQSRTNCSRKRLWWAAVLVPLGIVLAGCDDGPAENAGEAIDDAAGRAGDAAEDVTDRRAASFSRR